MLSCFNDLTCCSACPDVYCSIREHNHQSLETSLLERTIKINKNKQKFNNSRCLIEGGCLLFYQLDPVWHQWDNFKIHTARSKTGLWKLFCKSGLTWLTWHAHTENLLWGYHFNKREERYLIRKAAGAELKTSDKLQDTFQEAFTGLDASNFDFVFLLTVKANAFQDVYMSRQWGSFPGAWAGLLTTWWVSLFDTDSLSQGLKTGLPPRCPKMFLWQTHTHTKCGMPIKTLNYSSRCLSYTDIQQHMHFGSSILKQ